MEDEIKKIAYNLYLKNPSNTELHNWLKAEKIVKLNTFLKKYNYRKPLLPIFVCTHKNIIDICKLYKIENNVYKHFFCSTFVQSMDKKVLKYFKCLTCGYDLYGTNDFHARNNKCAKDYSVEIAEWIENKKLKYWHNNLSYPITYLPKLLYYASKNGDFNTVKELIDAGITPFYPNSTNYTFHLYHTITHDCRRPGHKSIHKGICICISCMNNRYKYSKDKNIFNCSDHAPLFIALKNSLNFKYNKELYLKIADYMCVNLTETLINLLLKSINYQILLYNIKEPDNDLKYSKTFIEKY